MSAPSIVALVSVGRRAAVAHLLAERASLPSSALVFATTTAELARSVTSESLVVIEWSRLGELATVARAAADPECGAHVTPIERGEQVESWLSRMPARTRQAWHDALGAPRAWSVKRVAHAAGVSTRQLVRQCHRAGCAVPPKDLLLAARIAAVQVLLRGPRRASVVDLAHACGWVDARSLRAALRRASLASIAALAHIGACRATVSDVAARLDRSA